MAASKLADAQTKLVTEQAKFTDTMAKFVLKNFKLAIVQNMLKSKLKSAQETISERDSSLDSAN